MAGSAKQRIGPAAIVGMVVFATVALSPPASSAADSDVLINEIMYHPATDEAALEWVEFYNQMSVDMDLSAWYVTGGITFTFPEGTVVPGGGFLLLAISPGDFEAATGISTAYGPFEGRLENAGERLELVRQDLEDTIIRAPFEGVVVSKDAQPGEMISPVSAPQRGQVIAMAVPSLRHCTTTYHRYVVAVRGSSKRNTEPKASPDAAHVRSGFSVSKPTPCRCRTNPIVSWKFQQTTHLTGSSIHCR